ncbi:MAG: periplasmic heavy metal sensor [Thioalkalispiraceae bacterium]
MNINTSVARGFLPGLFMTLLLVLTCSASHAHDSHYGSYRGMGHMYMDDMDMDDMGHMRGSMGMGHMGMGRMDMGRMGMGFTSMLELSAQQRKALRDIHRNNRTQRWALKDKIADYSDQLRTLYDADKPDAKTIGSVYEKIFDIQRQLIEHNINMRNQQYDVLTKKQKEKLKNWHAKGIGYRHGYDDDDDRGMHHMMR